MGLGMRRWKLFKTPGLRAYCLWPRAVTDFCKSNHCIVGLALRFIYVFIVRFSMDHNLNDNNAKMIKLSCYCIHFNASFVNG